MCMIIIGKFWQVNTAHMPHQLLETISKHEKKLLIKEKRYIIIDKNIN